LVEQGVWDEFGFEGDGGVEEAGLVGESYRFGGVERGACDEASEGLKAQSGGGQRGFWGAGVAGEVGSEADVGGGHRS
jgi:hypothetical protein